GLYLFVILRTLEAARLAKDRLGAYLVIGVLASFTFQVVYNITMSAGLAPVKGLTLPLMSYGGSSMIATLARFGLVLNVRMRRFTTCRRQVRQVGRVGRQVSLTWLTRPTRRPGPRSSCDAQGNDRLHQRSRDHGGHPRGRSGRRGLRRARTSARRRRQ